MKKKKTILIRPKHFEHALSLKAPLLLQLGHGLNKMCCHGIQKDHFILFCVGIGNFQEVGPLDTDLKPRNSTWLLKVDLLFVDNPVGTGYNFVEDNTLFVKTDEEVAADLTTLLVALYNKNKALQKSPLFLVAESYGGKSVVSLGLSIVKAAKAGELKLKLGGFLDLLVISLAEKIKQQIANGQYDDATNTWRQLHQDVILSISNNVDFHNFILNFAMIRCRERLFCRPT